MPTSPTQTYSNSLLEPALRPDLAVMGIAKLVASTNYPKGALLGEKIGTNEMQKLTPSVGANLITGGTYTITFSAQTTAAIAAIATASEIQTALEALSTIGNGNVKVTGGPLIESDVFIEFIGALAGANQAAVTATLTLTSGGTAAVTITTVRDGAAGTPGTYGPYLETATDGTQEVKAVLPYDVQTDGSGNITLSSTGSQSGGEFSQTYPVIDVYIAGYFNTADLVAAGGVGGIDGNAVKSGSQLALKQGTLASGLVRLN